jgi:hypothetical protein
MQSYIYFVVYFFSEKYFDHFLLIVLNLHGLWVIAKFHYDLWLFLFYVFT